MGGFSALIMPFYMPVRAVAAFSPQFSISPEVVPDEKRWEIYRDRISEIKIPSIKEFLADQTEYYVFHGRHPREAPQREPFPRKANLHHFIMRNTVHNTSQRLKQFGLLSDVIQAAFSRDTPRVTDLLGQALGKKRADETGNN
ncbi:MAG TPA: hypothetical protein DD729_07020 [Rhodobacteraceae bacterium]|jgi:hypothetical protein|nr:hypothetical protein [Paracoccaceae bacterium]